MSKKISELQRAKELFPLGQLVEIKFEGTFFGLIGEVKKYKRDADGDVIGVKILDCYKRLAVVTDRFLNLRYYLKDRKLRMAEGDSLLIFFAPQDLVAVKSLPDLSLSIEEKMKILFGSMYHSANIKSPFFPGIFTCEHEECKKLATLEIFVNICGTVQNWFVCPDHAFYHGRSCEDFPCKQPKSATKQTPDKKISGSFKRGVK